MKRHLTIFILLASVFFLVNAHAQTITTIAGTGMYGYSGDGGPATLAKIWAVDAVAVDSKGNIYIADRNSTVRKVNTSGIISTFAGNGIAGFSGDGGQATAAQLFDPKCITFDKKGNVYIADLSGNKRVRKVDTGGIITTFAGNGDTAAYGDGGPASAAGIGQGQGICADAAGNIYIDAHLCIRKVDAAGIITTYAGTGFSGPLGDGGPATAASVPSNGQIAMDMLGNLYIGDGGTNVRKINTAGIITTIAGNGVQGYSGDGGPATAAQLYDPTGVFPDRCGNIYIADFWNNRIRKVNSSGIITTVAGNGYGGGTGSGGFGGDGGPATAAELNHPETVYLDSQGSIYIADQSNFRVRYIHMDSCRNTEGVAATGLPTSNKLTLFPNPNFGSFTLNLASATNDVADVMITDVTGNVVKRMAIFTNKETELTLHVPAGMYFVSVTTGQGRYVERVLIE